MTWLVAVKFASATKTDDAPMGMVPLPTVDNSALPLTCRAGAATPV